jgi:Cyclic nucleotide-binding domain
MLARLLRRFEPFAALEWTTLCSVARHARLLRFAAQRTLSPNRGKHHGSCYLVKGLVRRRDKSGREQQIADQDAAARHPLLVAGDGTSVETLGAVTLLWIDVDPVAFMLGAETAGYAVERLDAAPDDHWMHRFLGPGLVEHLTPSALHSVFRAFDPIRLSAGETVVREGESADMFYVLANGSAEVRRRDRRLAALVPGDSFGADALVSGQRRNASVVMVSEGRVMRLPGDAFRGLVSERLVQWVDATPGAHAIDLSIRPRGPDGLRALAGELDLAATYVFDGATEGDRALAAFLATQRGVRAFARRGSKSS